MINSYTIGSLSQLPSLPTLDRVQFTLNSHMRPYRRRASEMITRFCKEFQEVPEIYIHEDYVRTLTRYPFLQQDYKSEMVKEVYDILSHPNVSGMVIHMDSPFSQALLRKSNNDLNAFISSLSELKSEIYIDVESIKALLQALPGVTDLKSLFWEYYRFCIEVFYNDIKYYTQFQGKSLSDLSLLYLENTTKVPIRDLELKQGSVMHCAILSRNHMDLYGVCYDTEHSYAIGDIPPSPEFVLSLLDVNKNILVHLNTIEKGVVWGSFKDKHSLTAIDSCKVYDYKYYLTFAKWLDDRGIPYIREVKTNVMQYELAFQKVLESSYPEIYKQIYHGKCNTAQDRCE